MAKISKKDLVTLVELPATEFGKLDGKLAYDVYSMFHLPPRALPTLASLLKSNGWENIEMITPIYHGKNSKLSHQNYKRIFNSAVLGLSSIARTSPQSMRLADIYKTTNPKGIVIAGGMDASYRIEEWLEYADIIVRGEAEKTFSELMERLTQDSGNLDDINGIAFKKGKEIIINKKRELMTADELGQSPHPYYDEAIKKGINIGVVEQQRGCPYNCNFCLVTATYGNKIRNVPVEKVIDEMKILRDDGMNHGIFFTGDNLAGNPKYALELMEAIKEQGLNKQPGTAQVCVSAAKNHELLQAMKDAGIKNLCVGFEAVTDSSLRDLGKPFTAEQNTEAAKTFRDYGFWIHAMMMLGTDNDTSETIKETLEWAKKYSDSSQFLIPTTFQGTPFYEQMKRDGRILTEDLSLFDGQYCVIKPANFSPYELQQKVFDAYKEFYSARFTMQRLAKSPKPSLTFKSMVYVAILRILSRGLKSSQTRQHLEFLKNFK